MKLFIELDDVSGIYTAGQSVSGTVTVDLRQEERTTGLVLACVGSAEVHYRRGRKHDLINLSNYKNPFHHRVEYRETPPLLSEHYTAQEKYFEYHLVLIGHPSGDGSVIVIPPGSQTHPFSFELPATLPASFIGSHGAVRYVLEARIKRPNEHYDLEAKTTFHILGQLDLNLYPEAAKHVEIRKQKSIMCLCCKKGPLGFSFKIDRAGFVAGDMLTFTANMFNMSDRELQSTFLQIIQNITYRAGKRKSTHESVIVLQKAGPSISPGETKVWESKDVMIPSVVPTRLGGCGIIELEYVIKVTIVVPKAFDLTGTIPIVIGTVPFQENLYEGSVPGTPAIDESTTTAISSSMSGVTSTKDANSEEI